MDKFKSIADCPEGVKNLTPEAQAMWMQIANSSIASGDTEDFANMRAWDAVKGAWEQDNAGKWVKKVPAAGGMFSLEDPTHELKGVEIFSSGEWNGDKYDEKALDEMVNNFEKGAVKVPLKIGHDAKQKFSGQPAVGWINRVYKQGKKIMADIVNVPKLVYELIKKKAYQTVSSEIAFNANFDGNIYNNLLVGVALLGGELPAVNSLADMPKLYNAEEVKVYDLEAPEGIIKEVTAEAKTKEQLAEEARVAEEAKKAEEAKAAEEEKAKIAKEMAEAEAASNGGTEVEKLKAELKAKEEQIAVYEKEKADKAIEEEKAKLVEFTDKLITDKKILPAMKTRVLKSLELADNTKQVEFALDEKTKVNETARENLKRFFESMGVLNIYKEFGKPGEAITSEAETIMTVANKMAEEKKMPFSKALIEVAKERPDLIEKSKTMGAPAKP